MQDTLEPNLTIANESGNHVVDLQPLPFREKPCLAGANTVRALNRDLVIDRLREEKLPRVTVDFDGSVLSTRGHAEGSAIGYNRQRKGARSYYRYYPLFCTVAQTGQFLDLLHRPGNVHDSRDALAFIEANIEFVREIVGVREIETRMGWVIVPCTLGWPWTWSSGPRLHGGSPRTDAAPQRSPRSPSPMLTSSGCSASSPRSGRTRCSSEASRPAGERYENLLTVLLNCELAGVNPYVYLVDVIDKIADDWPADRAAELLPRAWLAARQAEQQAPGEAALVVVT